LRFRKGKQAFAPGKKAQNPFKPQQKRLRFFIFQNYFHKKQKQLKNNEYK